MMLVLVALALPATARPLPTVFYQQADTTKADTTEAKKKDKPLPLEPAVQPVYHLAGAAHVAQSWQFAFETYQANVLATHHLLMALGQTAAPARVLLTCSGTIYRAQSRPLIESDAIMPTSPYATSKLAQEMLAQHAWADDGLPALVARSFNHTVIGAATMTEE